MIYTDIGTAHLENKNRIRKEVMKQGHKAAIQSIKLNKRQNGKHNQLNLTSSSIIQHCCTVVYDNIGLGYTCLPFIQIRYCLV